MREVLIEARGDRNQTDVATELGIAQQYLSEIERQNKTPSAKLMNRISLYYGKPVQSLFPDVFLQTNTTKWGIINKKEATNRRIRCAL